MNIKFLAKISSRWIIMQFIVAVILISVAQPIHSLASAPSIVNDAENIISHNHEFLTKDFHKNNQFLNTRENLKDLDIILHEYFKETFNKNSSFVIIPGIEIVPQSNVANKNSSKLESTTTKTNVTILEDESRSSKITATDLVINEIEKFADEHVLSVNIPRAVESGRLFFFKGINSRAVILHLFLFRFL